MNITEYALSLITRRLKLGFMVHIFLSQFTKDTVSLALSPFWEGLGHKNYYRRGGGFRTPRLFSDFTLDK